MMNEDPHNRYHVHTSPYDASFWVSTTSTIPKEKRPIMSKKLSNLLAVLFLPISLGTGCYFIVSDALNGASCEANIDCQTGEACVAGACEALEQIGVGESCLGNCGKELNGCFCDSRCVQNGDCCFDYLPECAGGSNGSSCTEYCGKVTPSGCFCDDRCVTHEDCCSNFQAECSAN